MFEVKVDGIAELNKAIGKVVKSLDPDKVEPILNKGARTISASVRSKAPKGPTGNLKKAVRTKKLKRFGRNPAPSVSAVDRKKAPHAHLVEKGSKGVRIGKRGSRKYRGKKFGIMPANAFFERGVEAKQTQVVTEIVAELKKLVEGAAKK